MRLCLLILVIGSVMPVFGQMVVKNYNQQPILIVSNSGQAAIGLNVGTPTATLDVSGKTKTEELQVGTSSIIGHILTAVDEQGTAEWRMAPSNYVAFAENLLIGTDWTDPGLTFSDEQVYFISIDSQGFDGSLYKFLDATMTLRADVGSPAQVRFLKGSTYSTTSTLASCLASDDNRDTNTYTRVPVHYNSVQGNYGFYVSTSGSGRVVWRVHGAILK